MIRTMTKQHTIHVSGEVNGQDAKITIRLAIKGLAAP
jgi:hypothetical protein